MQRERWQRLEQLFEESLQLPAAERFGFLDRQCVGDTELRIEIEELLSSHDTPGLLDKAPGPVAAPEMPPSLAAGTCLGVWKVDRLIGRGGMGEVYEASRVDAAFEQRAALKLLRQEAATQIERFHAERQFLARLEHPGIARLLDGGTTADGRPYTVMEYVEGVSLTRFCRERRANLHERLALFMQVCDAVAFAHRNLIIHRDLKPDNILVTADGSVKLLDFGIAKLIDTTAFAQDSNNTIAPFTPDYAAPEQLSGEPVSTATDIYALGVLLFELLTGERPMRMRGLPSTQALRLLMDREAPVPSQIARSNRDAPLPARRLKGDLDAIVAKCLRKEPGHRYDTVVGLKRDLLAHQRNEPVLALSGARAYVAGRLLRRYRWPLAGISLLVVTLAAGLVGTLWQARRADTQARTAAAVQTFLSDIFRANSSSQDDPVKARQTTARELLDIGATKIASSMGDAPAAKLSVQTLLGELYDDLALDDEAVKLRKQALDTTRSLYGPDSIETVTALGNLAGSMHASASVNERGTVLSEALEILDRAGDTSSPTRAGIMRKLAEHYTSSDPPRALGYAREALRLSDTNVASGELADSLYAVGLIEETTGLVHEAKASYSRAVEVSRRADGFPNPSIARYYAYLAQVQYRTQDIEGAENSARMALQTAKAINGEDHVDTLQTEMRLGRLLVDTGRPKEGLQLLESAKQLALKIRGVDDPFHTPQILLEHGYAQIRLGLLEEGLTDIEAAIANRRKNRPGTLFLATMLEDFALALVEMGRGSEAVRQLDEASAIKSSSGLAAKSAPFNFSTAIRVHLALAKGEVERARALVDELYVDPDESLGISFTAIEQWLLLAETELGAGNESAAVELARRARARITGTGLSDFLPFYLIRADLVEGEAMLQQKLPLIALPLLQRALTTRQNVVDTNSPGISEAQIALANCYLDLGDMKHARALADAARAIQASHKQLGEQYRHPLRNLDERLDVAGNAGKRFVVPVPHRGMH